jgi:hypothetical protein
MAVAMEAAKRVTAGWLARQWRVTAWIWRAVLVALVAGVAVINAISVYAQLVAAHIGDRGAVHSAIEMQDAALASRIEVAAHTVADLDRRLGQIDTARKRRSAARPTPPCRPWKPSAGSARASWTSETVKPVLWQP